MKDDQLFILMARLIGLMGRGESRLAAVQFYRLLKWTQVSPHENRIRYVEGMESRLLPEIAILRQIRRRPFCIRRMWSDYRNGLGIKRSVFNRRNWPRLKPWKLFLRAKLANEVRKLLESTDWTDWI